MLLYYQRESDFEELTLPKFQKEQIYPNDFEHYSCRGYWFMYDTSKDKIEGILEERMS